MSKKKVKGTKIDLRTLGDVSAKVALPKGPAERAEDDEGRFRRNHGKGDRGGDRGGYGGRDDRGGGFGGDRGGGGFSGGSDMGGRKPLNLTSSRAPMNSNGPPPAGGLFGGRTGGAAPPPAGGGGDKWSQLESSMGGGGQPQGSSRFSGLRDGDRGGGGFGRDRDAPPEIRSNSRFGFVNDEPREGPPRSSGDSRNNGPGGGQVDYARAASQPDRRVIGTDAASQVAANKRDIEIANKSKAEDKAARAAKKAEEKAAAEAAKLAEKEAKKAAKAAKKEAEKLELELATTLVASGAKGDKLVEAMKGKSSDQLPSPKAFITAVLTSEGAPTQSWVANDQYGAAVKFLCAGKGSIQKQAGVVYGCQIFYHGLKYPKTNESDGKRESLISKLFYHMFNEELIEEEAFNEWRYADDDDKEVPGKKDALFQLSEFLNYLDEPPSEDEDDEEEDPVTFERVELRTK